MNTTNNLNEKDQLSIFGLLSAAASFRLKNRFRFCRTKRKGAAPVEFAVVAPLLFTILFGILEFGRLLMVQQIITTAAREGARSAALDGADSSDVENVVDSYLSSSSIQGANVSINPSDLSSADPGDPVSVTVNIDFTDVSWLPSPMFLKNKTLSAETVMRRETSF